MAATGPADDGGSPEALARYQRAQQLLYSTPSRPEPAIGLFEDALELWTTKRAPRHNAAARAELGAALLRRTKGSRPANLDRAISELSAAREAFLEFPLDGNLPHVNSLLGQAVAYRGSGRPEDDLATALGHLAEGYRFAQVLGDPAAQAEALMGAGDVLRRQVAGGRTENRQRAVEVLEQAGRVLARVGLPEPAELHHNLGIAYIDRLGGNSPADVERAIDHLRAAIDATDPAAELDRAESRLALATAHLRRAPGDRRADADVAIAEAGEAANAFERVGAAHSLARALHHQAEAYAYRSGGDAGADLISAAQLHRRALAVLREAGGDEAAAAVIEHSLGDVLLTLGSTADEAHGFVLLRSALAAFTDLGLEDRRLEVLRSLATAAFERRRWPVADEALMDALATSDRLLDSAWSVTGRRLEAAAGSGLYAMASYCALTLGERGRALESLEAGQARLLGQALRLSGMRPADLPPPARQRFLQERQTVNQLEREELEALRSGGEPFARVRPLLEARRRLDAVLREAPKRFRRGLRVDELLAQVPAGGALVAPVVTSAGGACFVVPSGRTEVLDEDIILLEDLTAPVVRDLLSGGARSIGLMEAYRAALADRSLTVHRRWKYAIHHVTERMWALLMGPVHDRLERLGLASGAEVVMIPQGGLGVFPLHAARSDRAGADWFLDHWTVRYAPSGEALRSTQTRRAAPSLTLMAVVDPSGRLAGAPAEVAEVARLFPADGVRVVRGAEAVEDTVIGAATGRSYVHFASHAVYGWEDPLASRLALYGENSLDLEEVVARMELAGARLATLSACETGISEYAIQPDEYVGLPAGFLEAGARGVVSSLWAVSDIPTTMLMADFYRRHVDGGEAPAAALAGAQRSLRDAPAKKLVERPPWATGSAPAGLTGAWGQLEQIAHARPELCVFAHPTNWAAFTFTGG